MEVKVTLDLSERFAGCLDAAVEALKELKAIKVDDSKDHGQQVVGHRTGTFVGDYETLPSISLADLKKAGLLAIPKDILEEIRTGRLAHERSEFERSILQAAESAESIPQEVQVTEPAKEPAPVRKRAAEKAVKEVAPVSAKDGIELADLRVYLKKLWDAGHKDNIDTLFKSYDATGLKDLDPTKYDEVFQDLKEIIKAYEL